MIVTLCVVAAYIAGWLAFTVPTTRWVADSDQWGGSCHSPTPCHYRSVCEKYDGRGCWHADGQVTITRLLTCSAIGFVWPLALLPALAYWLATRRATPVGNARRIADLERELGIEP